MELLTQYFNLQKQIYEYFGYVEDWVVIPIEDNRDKHWYLDEGASGNDKVWFSDVPLTVGVITKGEQLYSCIVYTQRFLPKWVYRADDYTMICVDTQTDGNKFLSVFSNDKELVELTAGQAKAFRGW